MRVIRANQGRRGLMLAERGRGEPYKILPRLSAASRGSVYLLECAASGCKPTKPASGKLMLRIPPEVHGAALVAAQANGISLNQWAGWVLAEATQANRPQGRRCDHRISYQRLLDQRRPSQPYRILPAAPDR